MQKLHVIFFSLIISFWAHASQNFWPKSPCDQILEHEYYTVCYLEKHRQASWTYHKLELESLNGPAKRTNNYRLDPLLQNPVMKTDYKHSGYDRGHLVPAADMKINYAAMSDTFFMSNMSPQRARLNRGIWRSLEIGLRGMVKIHGDAYVITAPILRSGLEKLQSGVSIPQFFYKIAYFPESNLMRAYLLENRGHKGHHFSEFQVTVDFLEGLTKFDFFSELPDELEKKLESSLE